jgi:hypothetical protein
MRPSQQSAPPLIVEKAVNANVNIRTALPVGSAVITKHNGQVVMSFPFGAGTYTIYGCTSFYVSRLQVVNGALKIILELDQAPLCIWPEYRGTYRVRRFTNGNSSIEFHAGGQSAELTGTSGAITPTPGGAIFGLSRDDQDSRVKVTASNGQTAIIGAGQAAIATSKGIAIFEPLPPMLRIFRADARRFKVTAANGEALEVDGKPIRSGSWLNAGTIVRATNVLGDFADFEIKPLRQRNQR